MVEYAGSPICIVHVDMTMTQSKVMTSAMTVNPLPGHFICNANNHLMCRHGHHDISTHVIMIMKLLIFNREFP